MGSWHGASWYDAGDRKITVNAAEAERVWTIFRSYLGLGSLHPLMAHLRDQGIVTKTRTLKAGETVGGIPFTRGSLAHLLRNRFYVGEVVFKGEVLAGEQPPIVDRELFEAVQAKLTEQVDHPSTPVGPNAPSRERGQFTPDRSLARSKSSRRRAENSSKNRGSAFL